ncbi:MAG: gas vesicle protein GvpN [Anaerolineales bacterium]|nr:gas vesicle protein GvpN [Anaerolineales bacterium]
MPWSLASSWAIWFQASVQATALILSKTSPCNCSTTLGIRTHPHWVRSLIQIDGRRRGKDSAGCLNRCKRGRKTPACTTSTGNAGGTNSVRNPASTRSGRIVAYECNREKNQRTTPTALNLRPSDKFVETPSVATISERALAYVSAGYAVHFRGPAGAGKTTLALHVAGQLGRPVMLIAGDDEFGTSDLTGGQFGYSYRRTVDNFIHTVRKMEEDMVQRWVDHRLSTACREGYTLVYDEFTRSRPEANNVLLSVLEERILILPNSTNSGGYIKVHPNFTALFTSNPEEYAGVHASQDALLDRMVTIDLDFYDYDTEVGVTAARSGLSRQDAAKIVGIVRDFRASGAYQQLPTLRACIILGRVLANQNQRPTVDNPFFLQVSLDVLGGKAAYIAPSDERFGKNRRLIMDLIQHNCSDDRVDSAPYSGTMFDDMVEGEPIVNDRLLVGIGLDPYAPPTNGAQPSEGEFMGGADDPEREEE